MKSAFIGSCAIAYRCSRNTTNQTLEATKALENKIEEATVRLTAQLQGLQIGLQACLNAGASDDSGLQRPLSAQQCQAQRAIERQGDILGHCYRSCMAAFEETTKMTGHTYKYVRVCNQARFLMGNLGNVQGGAQHSFSNLDIQGGWVVAGNMEKSSAKDFFK